jgi:folate-binding protein YgfZ
MPPRPQTVASGRWPEARGAPLAAVAGGIRTVVDFGDPAAEHRALVGGCGLVDLGWLEGARVSGADRRRFLNGYLTCEVATLEPGQGSYGFLTDAKGRVLADATVAATGEELLLLLPPNRCEAVLAHLHRFVIADRVELEPNAEKDLLGVVGPRAAATLGAAGLPAPEADWSCGELEEQAVRVQRLGHRGSPAYALVVDADQAGEWAQRLIEAGAVPAGWTALETLRVEAGTPRFGADFGTENLPQETGLGDAVSYTKGCYLGQEVVARLHYRGRPQRGLAGLEIDAGRPPEPGAALRLEGQEVGTLGSAVASLRWPDRILGLAVVHRKAGEPGTELEISTGGAATVCPLPWSFVGGNP